MVYVLHYFAYSGRGELLRLIAEEGKMDYKEVIVDLKEFWEIRSKYPYGQLPMITEEGSDFELAQTNAIARLFGKETNLYPIDFKMAAIVDSIMDGVSDYRAKAYAAYFTPGEEAQQIAFRKYRDVDLKNILVKFDGWIKKNGGQYFVGDKLTIADIAVFDYMEENMPFINFEEDIPSLMQFRQQIASRQNISAYIHSERRYFNELGKFKLME